MNINTRRFESDLQPGCEEKKKAISARKNLCACLQVERSRPDLFGPRPWKEFTRSLAWRAELWSGHRSDHWERRM